MDEFQRFRDLIEIDDEDYSDSALLSKKFLKDNTNSCVLLLSATPYKPYSTLSELTDGEETHLQGFMRVMDFLMNEKEENEEFHTVWESYSEHLSEIQGQNLSVLLSSKKEAEGALYKHMCRTERRNSAIINTEKARFIPVDKLSAANVSSYMELQRTFRDMGYGNFPIEYIKSAPFLMSFMNYKVKDNIDDFLTGKKICEYTIASTGQLLDAKKRDFDYEYLEKMGVRTDLLQPLTMPGTIVGDLLPEVVEETGLSGVKVIAVGEHDTASAFCGCPLEDENAAALSCGTWSLLGMEVSEPVLTEDAFKYNYTNEGGVEGKIRLLKNINGLWVMQNLRRNWCEFEYEVGFPDIIKASREAARQDFIIDPNDPRFTAPYNMMKEVIAYCEETGQGTPEGLGEIAMAIYNGLTQEYGKTVRNLEVISGKTISCLNMVGGGIQDQLLCELTAKAIQKPVVAGPIEGSVLGNVLMQLKALGHIKDRIEGRKIVKASFEQKIHQPK